jgi:hypothetical protein
MNKYNFNSGSLNPNNDNIRLRVAMDPGSSSSLIVRNIDGTGIINYLTKSDYIYEVSRSSYKLKEEKQVDSLFADNLAYPSGLSFIPGDSICSSSSSEIIEDKYRMPVGSHFYSGSMGMSIVTGELKEDESNLYDVSMEGLESGNSIIPEDIFKEEWNVSGGIKISSLISPNDTLPFIDIENLDTSNGGIARFNIFSSELNGCFFEIELENDITSTGVPDYGYETNIIGDPSEINKKPQEILPFFVGGETEDKLIDEWNSIFKINENCNIEDEFSNGKNRDQCFIDAIRAFLDKNWDGSMRQFLWNDSLSDNAVVSNISTKLPLGLKSSIFYQLYYYGVSDDIKILSEYTQQKNRLGKCMEWHIGLGGPSKVSGRRRKLKREYTYLPTSRGYRNIYKVYDMPPRDSFSAISESDEKMFNNMGEGFTEKPKIVSGYYPLYTSKNYAETEGAGYCSTYSFNEKEYYMPSGLTSGVTYFHGDYDPQLLISYLGSQNFDYDSVSQDTYISGQEEYLEVYASQTGEAQQYIQETVSVSGETQAVDGLFEGIYSPDTGDYANSIGITDLDAIQEYANQSFLIDFFNENGG